MYYLHSWTPNNHLFFSSNGVCCFKSSCSAALRGALHNPVYPDGDSAQCCAPLPTPTTCRLKPAPHLSHVSAELNVMAVQYVNVVQAHALQAGLHTGFHTLSAVVRGLACIPSDMVRQLECW